MLIYFIKYDMGLGLTFSCTCDMIVNRRIIAEEVVMQQLLIWSCQWLWNDAVCFLNYVRVFFG